MKDYKLTEDGLLYPVHKCQAPAGVPDRRREERNTHLGKVEPLRPNGTKETKEIN